MLRRRDKRQAGDTLIEVLLAVAIFSTAAATLTRTMNDGFALMFSNGQQSQIQALMRGQLAIIQKAHEDEVKNPASEVWGHIIDATTPANDVSAPALADNQRDDAVNADGCTYSQNKNRVYFTTNSGEDWTVPKIVAGSTTADVPVAHNSETPQPNGNSMWIEVQYKPAVTTPQGVSRGFYDFYVKACWSDKTPRQQKTVLRLYDPKAPVGEGSAFPSVSSPPIVATPPLETFTIRGDDFVQCFSINPGERSSADSEPLFPLFSSPQPRDPFRCNSLADIPHSNFSCSNYDVAYGVPGTATPGRYRMKINYRDANCGAWDNDTSPGTRNSQLLHVGSTYSYQVAVYKGNTRIGPMYLVADGTQGAIEFPELGPGDTIGLRWWNNHPTVPDGRDPDFVITRIVLEKIE